ncbi:MAG TPA: ABC transporter permease [Longimicrobiales bacterium]|nr:ABC transporter permease [Longimicrobiales bacterium]
MGAHMLADPVTAPATVEVQAEDSNTVIALSGVWQLDASTPRWADVLESVRSPAAIGFDSDSLGEWDSSLLIFLLQVQDHCEAGGIPFDTAGLPDRTTRLLELARVVPDRAAEPEATQPPRVERLGAAGIAAWDAAMTSVTFTGAVTDSVIRLLLRRTRLRWREFWVVVQSNSSGALGIVTLIALLVGVIIAFLGVVVLKRFGAGYYVSYLVGYGMLREMGALMTGIIMAGRTGAAFAAELGSMKITEEIDAYTTLGISPIDHLVLPRMLGLFVMMPLLVIYADFVGIAGGMMVAVTLLDLTPTQFIGGLLSAVTLSDALLGVFKASIFGLIIGLSGCMKGMQTGSDAGAVGRSATNAVVMGITLIILANAVVDWLAALLQI